MVKEHRLRYQKEQYDRMVESLHNPDLKKDVTLRQFSEAYSEQMEMALQSSHNFRCHKIDANYDDYTE